MKAIAIFIATPFLGIMFIISGLLPIDNPFGMWIGETAAHLTKRLFNA